MFVDRIRYFNELSSLTSLDNLVESIVIGESGVGKTSLLKEVFQSNTIYIDDVNDNYLYSILSAFVADGLHEYLLNIENSNYRDIYFSNFRNIVTDIDTKSKFIINNDFINNNSSFSIDKILSQYIRDKIDSIENINLIFDNFENCNLYNYGIILKLKNDLLSHKINKRITIIYSLNSSRNPKIYEKLSERVNHLIQLEGLESIYIEKIIQELLVNDNHRYNILADHLYREYNGNPSKIITIIKSNINLADAANLSETDIMNRIISPNFNQYNSVEKSIMLIISIMKRSIKIERVLDFLFFLYGRNDVISFEDVIQNLIEKEILINNKNNIIASSAIKKLFNKYSRGDIFLINLIYEYQKSRVGELSNSENADLLNFIFESNTITFDDYLDKLYFKFNLKTAQDYFKIGYWNECVNYGQRIIQHNLITEKNLVFILKAFYYNSNYKEIENYLLNLNDEKFNSYEYWYWKGNILYMLNNENAISCIDKAICFATDENSRIYAKLTRKQAISESPRYCSQTLTYYEQIIGEYQGMDLPALAALYRNSLVLGGEKTIRQCDEGIRIAQIHNLEEELIKLNHNKHFECFRMQCYGNCKEVFLKSVNYFQNFPNKIYEAAYGFNNLALVCLIEGNYEEAYLYAMSAKIYAGTQYSIITTHVNSNLIASFLCQNEDKIDKNVEEIISLIKKFEINDDRIYRKTYFSIAISYINIGNEEKAIDYIRKSELYLKTGRHINRYYNICKKLRIKPIDKSFDIISKDENWYNFYANPSYELWLLAYGHI